MPERERERNTIQWTVPSSDSIRLRVWDDGLTVVYNDISGDTHLLSPVAGEILCLLKSASHSSESLLLELEEVFSAQDTECALDAIETVLSELENINLVSSAQN